MPAAFFLGRRGVRRAGQSRLLVARLEVGALPLVSLPLVVLAVASPAARVSPAGPSSPALRVSPAGPASPALRGSPMTWDMSASDESWVLLERSPFGGCLVGVGGGVARWAFRSGVLVALTAVAVSEVPVFWVDVLAAAPAGEHGALVHAALIVAA